MENDCRSSRQNICLMKRGTVMKKNTRKILSVLLTMIMVMSFACPVFANETVPEDWEEATEAPVAAETAVSEAAETSAAPEADESAESEAADVQAEMDKPEPEDTAAETVADVSVTESAAETVNDVPVTESTDAAPETLEASRRASGSTGNAEKAENITIDGTSIDGSEDSSGNGWTYEKESGRIVLRDYTGSADITSDGTGVEIVSTGYNRIGTLSCDGDINVIGTGVLLVDKVELAEGCSFNLLPLQEYYGEDGGSVAVFLQQEDGSYMLINGNVKGIIDEKLELPEDIRLVLPADSLLELQALIFRVETDEDGNRTGVTDISGNSYTDYHDNQKECYGGHLYVGDLTLNKGATIKNNNLGEAIVASIIVAGKLINDGLISGGAVTLVQKDSGSGGLYSGSGSIEDSYITLRASQTMSINIKDSVLNLEQGEYEIEQLGLTGNSKLYYGGNFGIDNIKGNAGSSLNIYSFDIRDKLKLTGEVDRTAVLIKSGITELRAGLVNGGTVNNATYGGPVFNYSGSGTVSDGTKGSVFLGPDNVSDPDPRSIPVVSFYLHKTVDYSWNITLEENMKEGQEYAILNNYNAAVHYNSQIKYNELMDTYFPEGPELDDGQSIIFEVLRCKDRELSMTILGEGYEHETDSDGVFLIRLAYLDPYSNQHGGTTATSTRAGQTGTGNIGGNSNSILKGTGITRFSSADPVEPDPVKPDPYPVKSDPVKADTAKHGDPAKSAKEYTVAAAAAHGDTFEIRINEFDLNEDDENAGKVPYYNLSVYVNGVQISRLSEPVRVGMDCVLPEELKTKPLYAVFASENESSDETLMAVSAAYDEENGKLTFETSQAGEFIILAFEFDGEEFSPGFYDELEKTDEAKLFIKHLKEKEE